jgi:hypothetical protein
MPQIGRVLRRPAGRLLLRRWQHDGPIMQKDKGMVPYRIVPAGSSSGWRASTVLTEIKRGWKDTIE